MSRVEALRQVLGIRAGQRIHRARMAPPPKAREMAAAADWASRYPPQLTLSSQQAPFIAGWEVGKTYTLVLQAKLDRLEETAMAGGPTRAVARMTVTEVTSG